MYGKSRTFVPRPSNRQGKWAARIRWSALFLASAVLATVVAATPAAQSAGLSVERITSLPKIAGTAPSSPKWSPDGSGVAFLWNDQGLPFLDIWLVDAASGPPRRITELANVPPPSQTGEPDSSILVADRVGVRSRGGGASAFTWTPDGRALVFMFRGDLFEVRADGSGLIRLTHTGGGKHSFPPDPDVPPPQGTVLTYSPDGRYVSFLRDGELWLYKPAAKLLAQATRLSLPPSGTNPGGRFYQPDRGVASYQWSPNGEFIALYIDDRTRVRKVAIPNYLGEETTVNMMRRGFPGEDDLERTILIYSVEQGRPIVTLNVPDPSGRVFSSYSWSPDGKQLLIDQWSPDAVHRWVSIANPIDGSVRELWHDHGTFRITQFWVAKWQSDGKGVLVVTDVDNWHHLYSLPLNGQKPTPLTRGDWSIVGPNGTASVDIAPATKQVFFVSSQKNPYERQVYRMAETGGAITQVTALPGTHVPIVSPDGTKLATLHSNDVTPTELYLVDTKGGVPERRITHSPLKEFDKFKWVQPRYVTFKSRTDGITLHGRLIVPPNLDPAKKYPAVLGPVYLDTVRNRWGGDNGMLQQYMALEGQYVGLQVDTRGSVGYGRKIREGLMGHYGTIDVEDLHSGVEFLNTLGYVDPNRIGIWGSSYGGMLTVWSLFKKPGVYKAGAAGAPCVYLPHFLTHDVRRIGHPETHPELFRDSSALLSGENLQDHLMIIHGMQDDVVLFKDTVVLAEKLMMLGKDFDFVFAPSAVHGWSSKDYYATFLLRKIVGHFDRYLGRGGRSPTSSETRSPPR